MKVNPLIFRAYDLRGIAGTDLNPEVAQHIGKAYGTYLMTRGLKEAVVGHDSRITSPAYRDAIVQGLMWSGIDVIDIGMTLVGTFYWSQYFLKRKGGVFVTASHNPPEYNGFKFAADYSETLVEEGMAELLELVQTEKYIKGEKSGAVKSRDVREAYYADLVARVPIGKRLRAVVDASCATAGAVIPELLRRAGCEVVEKNCVVNSSFPLGLADPTSAAIVERLGGEVREAGADVGFSYDADGDRIGIVDEKGHTIWNDMIVALLARDVLHDHPGAAIMYNALCSKAVEESILAAGGKPFMWRVGHSFLKKKNQEVKAAFIGELSGHFFFSADFYNHDDGAYATLRFLRYLSREGKPLSEIARTLPLYISSPEIKVYCADERKAPLIADIAGVLRKHYAEAKVIDDERIGDGVRLEFGDAMMVLRYSQNGPYLTVKFEAKTEARYSELKRYILALLKRSPEVDFGSSINLNLSSLE